MKSGYKSGEEADQVAPTIFLSHDALRHDHNNYSKYNTRYYQRETVINMMTKILKMGPKVP